MVTLFANASLTGQEASESYIAASVQVYVMVALARLHGNAFPA